MESEIAVTGSAIFGENRTRRYWLTRTWDPLWTPLLWIMLNPSIAGGFEDDPTIRRCIGFSRKDHGGIEVVNLFGLIATDPRELVDHPDPVGDRNRSYVDSALRRACCVVLAWGATVDKVPAAAAEIGFVYDHIRAHDVRALCFGTTKAGHPKHPLYLAGDSPWEAA